MAWPGEGLGVIERKRRISGHPRLLQTRLAPFSKVSVKFLAKQYHVILLLLSLDQRGLAKMSHCPEFGINCKELDKLARRTRQACPRRFLMDRTSWLRRRMSVNYWKNMDAIETVD